MNKLYAIHFYFKGIFINGIGRWNRSDIERALENYPDAYLYENNSIHELWRVDIA